jgi:hypothetical protein
MTCGGMRRRESTRDRARASIATGAMREWKDRR